MPILHAFLFAGTGQDPKAAKHNYGHLKHMLTQAGYTVDDPYIGIGTIPQTGPVIKSKKHFLKKILGTGWEKSIAQALQSVEARFAPIHAAAAAAAAADDTNRQNAFARSAGGSRHLGAAARAPAPARPDRHQFVCMGLSRGGVQALIMANILSVKYPSSRIFIGTMDPVPGLNVAALGRGHCFNSWSDIKGKGFLRQFGLDAKTVSSTVFKGVSVHCNILMQFTKDGRKAGFTPLSKALGTLTIKDGVGYEEFLMIGDHSDCSSSNIQRPSALCAHDIFFHYMQAANFNAPPTYPCLNVLENYSKMVMKDLAKKGEGKSFVQKHTEHAMSTDHVSPPTTFLYGMKGRERLIAAADTGVGFVNQRHQALYKSFVMGPIFNRAYTLIQQHVARGGKITSAALPTRLTQLFGGEYLFFPHWLLYILQIS